MKPSSAIIPVILSGGAGTRLWPLSRETKPKQFMAFTSGATLLEATVQRCQGNAFDSRPIIVGAEAHRFLLAEAVRNLSLSADIVLEPLRRDSCAAIVAGALQARARHDDALVLVVAADHHIPDAAAFQNAVLTARPAAEAGRLVTFGVKPSTPSTGYGYIKPGETVPFDGLFKVAQFIEKPDIETAKRYLSQGYLWNSGNFLFRARDFLAEARQFVPAIVEAVSASLDNATRDPDFVRLDEAQFAKSPRISVDFAVMEKTAHACVLPVDYAWSDIGTWDSVAAAAAPDQQGNAVVGRGAVQQARNVFIHSHALTTAVVGVDDIMVVATPDAVLVIRRGESESVKTLVEGLLRKGLVEN